MLSGAPNASPKLVSTIRRGASRDGNTIQKITAGEVRWYVQLTFALSLLVMTNNAVVGARTGACNEIAIRSKTSRLQHRYLVQAWKRPGLRNSSSKRLSTQWTGQNSGSLHTLSLADAINYASGIRQLPAWRGIPDSSRPPKEVRKGSV